MRGININEFSTTSIPIKELNINILIKIHDSGRDET